ncbi:EF-hand domain [Dillenia turbinata]|uniref:EF-hand domain n=1 Tax=Dillenia turbinata TaxID=194707 RepID=A0AAN8Z5J7_9MAGN
MSVAILNGLTVTEFVKDKEAFEKCITEHFLFLDVNGDGVLSRAELRKGFDSLLTLATESGTEEETGSLYEIVFEKFDTDHNGSIDIEEFKSEMKEIMLAIARGIGDSPVEVALESNSFLMKAIEHEIGKMDIQDSLK